MEEISLDEVTLPVSIPDVSEIAPEPEPRPQEAVRVKVYKDIDGMIKLSLPVGRTTPTLGKVLAVLPAVYSKNRKVKDLLPYGRSSAAVVQAIAQTEGVIPFQTWADAIGDILLQEDANQHGATFVSHPLKDSAYLAVGDTLFRLSPVELIKTNKALTAVKKRATEKAKLEADQIISSGKLSAESLVADAAMKQYEAQRLVDQAKRDAARLCAPPKWVIDAGIPAKYKATHGIWMVQFGIQLNIERFDINFDDNDGNTKSFSWEANSADTKPVALWVPIDKDGNYNFSSISVDRMYGVLPHVNHDSACMAPADAPNKITDRHSLSQLRDSVQWCLRAVQLDSLFCSTDEWIGFIKPWIPDDLYEALSKSYNWRDAQLLAKKLDAESESGSVEGVEEETEAEWTTGL